MEGPTARCPRANQDRPRIAGSTSGGPVPESLPYPKLESFGHPREIVLLPERLWQARAEWQAVPVMDDCMVRKWWDYVRL